jgi:energy-coupling factor transport system permease protein
MGAAAMKLTLYVAAETAIHRLHPVTKLLGLAGLVAAAFVVDAPGYLLPILAVVLGLLAAAGALSLVARFRMLFAIVFVFTVVVWTLFFRGGLAPSVAGFWFGVATALRLATFLATGMLFLATTRVEEAAYGLVRLGVPYKVGFTLTLAFRLVPLFFDAATTILEAQRCRGLDAASGGVVARLRRFAPLIVPVFVGALRRADRMAMALELRGFNSGRPRTTLRRPAPAARDAVAVAVTLALVAAYGGIWLAGAGRLAP